MTLSRLFLSGYMAYHSLGQARYPYKPLGVIKQDQARRVRAAVAHAYSFVPYYHDIMGKLGLRPTDFRVAEDLRKLPVLRRDQVQRDPEYFVSKVEPLDRHLRIRNSGSMGKPCTFYYDARCLCQDAAHGGRARAVVARFVGRSSGYRKTQVFPPAGSMDTSQRFYHDRTLVPAAFSFRRQRLSLLDPPELNQPLMEEFKPDVIQTYGSYAESLFAYSQATGKPFHHPKILLYTADQLADSARKLIEEEFEIQVLSIYEATAAYNIGFECERHKGLHLNIDLVPVRVVDIEGRDLPDGESGDLVVSNLTNRGTMLLNYHLGDVAAILPESCPCGRSLPLLTHVQGRSDDWMKLPSGEMVHPQVMARIVSCTDQIWQWQVVELASGHLKLSLVPTETCNREETAGRIRTVCTQTLGTGVQVDVEFVDSVERTPAGKVRPVISLLAKSRAGSGQESRKGDPCC